MFVLDSENNARWDANLRLRYQNQFWAGASYRNSKNMILMLGLILGDKFNISYSYDFNTSYPNVFSKTHEIGLGLMLFKKKNEIPYFL
jgi:hypothetical protein